MGRGVTPLPQPLSVLMLSLNAQGTTHKPIVQAQKWSNPTQYWQNFGARIQLFNFGSAKLVLRRAVLRIGAKTMDFCTVPSV